MKDTNVKIEMLKGIYEKYPQPVESVMELVNWQVDQYTGGWSNRIGYEKYDSSASSFSPFVTNRIDSLFYSQRHQGSQDSILFEQAGVLYQLNDFVGTLQKKILSTGRTQPKSSEVGTQYAQFGRFVLYANGYDRPGKTHLWPCTSYTSNYLIEYPLGFQHPPSAPVVWGIETDPSVAAANGDKSSIWFYTQPLPRADPKNKGLGIAIDAKENKYKYKVSFVNTAGSEGPMSTPSNTVEWDTTVNVLLYAVTLEIPIGNNDVVARRIYRTKNFSDDAGNDGLIYYFVSEIPNNKDDFFIDDIPDASLGSVSPLITDSITFPSMQCRYLGVYKDCLFIDGGIDNDLILYYSYPAQPDRYAALSFLTLAHRQGGGLTGFFSYFNILLVFREYSIDIVRGDYPNFSATNLTQYIGTPATNTIKGVVGLGVLFLSYDGVYSININVEYSDNPTVKNITSHLRDTFERINKDAISKACAVYSKKRREYIVHFPIDGSPVNNLALVYHTDKGSWSIRENIPAGQLIVNAGGDVLFGMADTVPNTDTEHGIMVLSRKRTAGSSIVADVMTDKLPLVSTMRSAWLDLGDPATKKKIHSIYLFIATGGDQPVSLDYYMDFEYNKPNTTLSLRQQRPDFIDQNVYDKVKLDVNAFWEEPLVTTVRYDVHSQACSYFQWRIQTQKDVHIIGYAIDFTSAGMRVIKGKKL
jgi:hypothetical protein